MIVLEKVGCVCGVSYMNLWVFFDVGFVDVCVMEYVIFILVVEKIVGKIWLIVCFDVFEVFCLWFFIE